MLLQESMIYLHQLHGSLVSSIPWTHSLNSSMDLSTDWPWPWPLRSMTPSPTPKQQERLPRHMEETLRLFLGMNFKWIFVCPRNNSFYWCRFITCVIMLFRFYLLSNTTEIGTAKAKTLQNMSWPLLCDKCYFIEIRILIFCMCDKYRKQNQQLWNKVKTTFLMDV